MKLLRAPKLLATVLILVGFTIALALGPNAEDYAADGRCEQTTCIDDGCESAGGFCNQVQNPDGNPVCDCTGEDCWGDPTEPVPASLWLSSGDPSTIWRSGNRFMISRSSAFSSTFAYESPNWSEDSETHSIPSANMTIEITGSNPQNPNIKYFTVTDLVVTGPSVSSVALSGGQTGTNTIGLRSSETGVINTTTGAMSVVIDAWLLNDYFSTTQPGLIRITLSGSMNTATGTATIDYSFSGWNFAIAG